MRLLYSLLLYLVCPFALGYLGWRGWREPEYLQGWGQRLGFFGSLPAQGIWLHAASVGEVQAAVPLVKALQADYPDLPLLMTTFTPTGRARARAALPESVDICFVPLDLPHATGQFIRKVRPRLAIVVETELWPNLLHSCRAGQVPVLLANASISARSLRSYQKWPLRNLIGPAVRGLTRITAASEQDADAFASLGVELNRLMVSGNLKFDLDLPVSLAADGENLRSQWQAAHRPVWVAASTHAGEEQIALDAHRILLEQQPDTLLVLVPRHPQRFDDVRDQCKRHGFAFATRSGGETVNTQTQVLLGDTLGELTLFFAAADVALVGGSLVPGIGGHNLLEPAALRLPIVIGPHAIDWKAVAGELEAAGGLVYASDAAQLASALAGLLCPPESAAQAGQAAAAVVERNRGALQKTVDAASSLLNR